MYLLLCIQLRNVCVRERQTDRERERKIHVVREEQKETDGRETEVQGEVYVVRQRNILRDRERERERERERKKERERETENQEVDVCMFSYKC